MRRLFAAAQEDYVAAMKSLRQQSAAQDVADAQWQRLQLQDKVSSMFYTVCNGSALHS